MARKYMTRTVWICRRPIGPVTNPRGNLPVSGRLVENYIKSIDDKATPTEELAAGETKPPRAARCSRLMVGTVTNIDVTDSEDGTQYVMTVTRRMAKAGESDRVVRFSKLDDDKVVVNIDLTDASRFLLARFPVFVVGYRFRGEICRWRGHGRWRQVSGYSDLKAKVVVKRGSTVLSEFGMRSLSALRPLRAILLTRRLT